MLFEKFPLEPLPITANQFCPHCGKQAYKTKFQNIMTAEIINVVICEEKHAFTMDVDDEDFTIEQWNLRV